MLPSFSIVTCTWNSATTLGDTIRSVQAQDYPHVEHIFVDGGSTDGTLQMIAHRCPRAIVVSDIKGGISQAMNSGINAANGEIIAHLHSDDYYASERVLACVSEQFQAHPSSQWAFGNIEVLREGILQCPKVPQRRFTFRRFATGRVTVPHPAVFIRREAFASIGTFDTSLKYAMDIDLWFRLGRRFAPIQIDEPLTVFREHEGSRSTANRLKAQEEQWEVRKRYFLQAPVETGVFWLRRWLQIQGGHRDR